ncbi:serine/threonine protein kinase [Pyxidicoccus sp. 3LG]
MQTGDLNPAGLPSGTQVGRWRVVAPQGRGTYGAVYRAVSLESAAAEPVALKLALYPRDERFPREAELLRRIHHPNVPRLLDSGDWLAPSGTPYPYLAMQFLEGAPLYDWAREQTPSSRQVLHLLASLSRALAATHAVGGVHRDVKGGNVLVRDSDAQPFLMDFGAGHYVGASTLTWQLFPPGTPAYRSPEAWGYVLRADPDSAPPYSVGFADDVFALGVTAYRLLTRAYPPSTNPEEEGSHLWQQNGSGVRPPRVLNERCSPELSALVCRMLSVRPEARGSARELAEALEEAARSVGPAADVPLYSRDAPWPERVSAPRRRGVPRARERAWPEWPRVASLGVTVVLGAAWWASTRTEEEPTKAHGSMHADEKDGGTVAVGDSALTPQVSPMPAPVAWTTIAVEVPPKPFPGQKRPDANGRCPGRSQVPIHGGCWIKVTVDPKDCGKEEAYVYQGGCYLPVLRPPRPPTSSPARSPDGR